MSLELKACGKLMNVHIAITNELLKATEAVGFYY
jgi:hypothetical protein